MELDRFKSAWQQQDSGPESRLRDRMAGTDRAILTRDRIEMAAVAMLIPLLALIFWKVNVPLVRIGVVWSVCAMIHAVARLWLTRRRTPPLDPSLPVLEFCDREIRRVQDQIKLLQTAGVWYVFPLLLGPFLIYAGASGWSERTAWYSAALIVFGVIVTIANRRAAKTQLEPLATRLRQLRDSLTGGPALEEDPRQLAILMDEIIRDRDRRETVAAVLGSLSAAATAWAVPNGITAIGALMMILTWIFAVARMHITQRGVPPPDPSLPDSDFCERELRRVDSQVHLRSTASYWFYAPLVIGAPVLIVGVFGWTPSTLGPAVFCIFVGMFLGRASLDAVRMELKPLAEQLRAWKESL